MKTEENKKPRLPRCNHEWELCEKCGVYKCIFCEKFLIGSPYNEKEERKNN